VPPSRPWARAVDQALALDLGLQPFRPRRHWFNGDLQTLRDTLRTVRLGPDQGEPITIPVGGGDQLLALFDPPLQAGREPLALVLLLHGLGGVCRADFWSGTSGWRAVFLFLSAFGLFAWSWSEGVAVSLVAPLC